MGLLRPEEEEEEDTWTDLWQRVAALRRPRLRRRPSEDPVEETPSQRRRLEAQEEVDEFGLPIRPVIPAPYSAPSPYHIPLGEQLERIPPHPTLEEVSGVAGEELKHRCAIARTDKTAFTAMLTHEDVGKIAWRPNRKASNQSLGFWQIIYKNMRGSVARGCSGLSVPSANLAGTPWSTQEQLDAASMVLKKARAQWNLSDCSTAERLSEELDDTT